MEDRTIREWLFSHGGRTMRDLYCDKEKKFYVFMTNGYYCQVRVYLPDYLLN